MAEELRAGVIGLGVMGKHHARIYHELPGVELIGVADSDEAIARQIATRYGVPYFSEYEELLKCDLDLVSIALPTSLHLNAALAAADAQVSMLIEKPVADTLESAYEIVNRCEEKGVKLMTGHVERFNPVLPVIKTRTSDLSVISIDIARLGPLPPRIKDVGVVIDLAVHDIDIIRFLTGSEFRKVQSLVTTSSAHGREDTALLSFQMENGVLCHINTNWLTPFKVREVNVAAKEKLVKGWLMEQKVCEYEGYGEDGSYLVREIPVPKAEPLKLEIQAFVSSIVNDEQPPITGADGIKALEVARQCLGQSAAE